MLSFSYSLVLVLHRWYAGTMSKFVDVFIINKVSNNFITSLHK